MNEVPALPEPLASGLIEGKTQAHGISIDPYIDIEIMPSLEYPDYFRVRTYYFETKPHKPINRHGLATLLKQFEPEWQLCHWEFSAWNPPDKEEQYPNQSYVYFIQAEKLPVVKIGVTDSIRRRFADLQTASPVRLVLLGFIECEREYERELHAKFNHLRSHGEWFRLDAELSQFIKSATKEGK